MNKKFLIIPVVVIIIIIIAVSQGTDSDKKDQTVFHVTLADPDQYNEGV